MTFFSHFHQIFYRITHTCSSAQVAWAPKFIALLENSSLHISSVKVSVFWQNSLIGLTFFTKIFLYIQENLRMTFFSHLHQIFYRITHTCLFPPLDRRSLYMAYCKNSLQFRDFNSSLHILGITAR